MRFPLEMSIRIETDLFMIKSLSFILIDLICEKKNQKSEGW